METTDGSAMTFLYSMFKISKWFYETYSEELVNINSIRFHPPVNVDVEEELKTIESQYHVLESQFNELLEERQIGKLSQEKNTEIKKRSISAASKS